MGETEKAIRSLNRNKFPDFHGITAENLIYGGQILMKYIQKTDKYCATLHILCIGIV